MVWTSFSDEGPEWPAPATQNLPTINLAHAITNKTCYQLYLQFRIVQGTLALQSNLQAFNWLVSGGNRLFWALLSADPGLEKLSMISLRTSGAFPPLGNGV